MRVKPNCYTELDDNKYRCKGLLCKDGSLYKKCCDCIHVDLKVRSKGINLIKINNR